MKPKKNERGAVAVEMALLLPVLLLILIGVIEFGRALNVQVSLTEAAREGARYAAVHYQEGGLNVSGKALAAAPSLSGLGVTVTDNAAGCAPGSNVTVTTNVSLPSMSGFLDAGFFGARGIFPLNMQGVGVMRCGG
ncbi:MULTISPECIES: TadE/TadG family type IV pilus assembly protein [Paenarthrobacter]|uniref:Pilus assembly protein n=1 Tax=Paenarthrobacter ureafaciens TaxID=37931 RepID=A0AAX3EEV3_PAEUR|nr:MULTISPECIES: TadE/TadG family type IV pilus assembly protein [Paenarthrobacter]NKR10046.1 pilus assembly protein TadE [Arthrobacter sp. M5]NKR14651.1 pilus assembly protein TadE [Arthrobacter sp. M6]OEH60203.1 pilus assembly protein TadE [Arthrobacter sp. D4]OEH60818.1 pilus assembly protein TadE [Arthrobacter sp. D2]MDO5865652.1 pilus assembly protein [Paenarthrobacter sp. SD-2]